MKKSCIKTIDGEKGKMTIDECKMVVKKNSKKVSDDDKHK